MAFTGIVMNPRVVVQGGAVVKDNTYKANAAGTRTAWKAGDILTKNTNGTVEILTDADSKKPVLMALTDWEDSATPDQTNYKGDVYVPVLELARDTVLLSQYDVTGGATPSQALIGTKKDFSCVSGKFSVDSTDTRTIPPCEIVDIWANANWFRSGDNEAGAYGLVLFKINPAIFDEANSSASS